MRIRSDDIAHMQPIPQDFAFGMAGPNGEAIALAPNRNPHLAWSEVPAGTRSFVLMCIDSDVPTRGDDVNKPGTFAYSCLVARRLLERGTRFVQIFHRDWDQHGNIAVELPNQCKDVDQGCYALMTDLKQRGLLEDTLVIWGG